MSLNLAREPFVNERPLRRISRTLWVLGIALALINAFLFWRYLSGSSELRGQIRETRAAISEEQQILAALDRDLAAFDLDDQNQTGRIPQRPDPGADLSMGSVVRTAWRGSALQGAHRRTQSRGR